LSKLENESCNGAWITVICFRDELSSLPLFCGANLLVVENDSKSLSQWRSNSIDQHDPTTKITNIYVGSVPFTQQSLVGILYKEDIIILMASAENQKIGLICSWLQPVLNCLSLFATWPQKKPPIHIPPAEGFNTCLFANTVQQGTQFVRSIGEMVTNNIIIRVDFADIREAFSCDNTLLAIGSGGTSNGPHRAITATSNVLETIDISIPLATVFVSIFSGLDFELSEFSVISELIESKITDDDCMVVIGIIFDSSLVDTTEIRVEIITCSYAL